MQPLTLAYNPQVHQLKETTPLDLVSTRPPFGLIFLVTVLQDAGTHSKDLRGSSRVPNQGVRVH